MKDAVAAYLSLRHAAGFEMVNAEYLLGSFARFAASGTKPMSVGKPRSIGPLKRHPRRSATND